MAIPESVCRRTPSDLLRVVQKQNEAADVPIHEQIPADVETEVISARPFCQILMDTESRTVT